MHDESIDSPKFLLLRYKIDIRESSFQEVKQAHIGKSCRKEEAAIYERS